MKYQTKNKVLVIGFVVVLILCYQLAISNTVVLKNTYHNLKEEELLFKNTPKQLSLLSQQKKYYDTLLKKYQMDGGSIQNNLLKKINSLSQEHQLKVVEFLEPHVFSNNEMMIKTYQFTVEGDYNAIIKLVNHLEQQTVFGEIINLHFEKKLNFRTNKSYLQAHVLLKSYS
ncbi:hypothetical protein QVZ41_13625 [Wenyingzhuangia sp. chi5]|uniref:Type IV pilus assembly protein PilO n=1 Tax=Wenyingzhuangia gilva TaxID=3057677 RepID=A0ABT8VV74_9FLAO|nr:hypothetical protein [Wenyingzhuangia sp. chi5]MDO3695885.1 hypothetical protein [Wenyingzhuangia sp. chi5]